MKCIAIDDEPLALNVIKDFCSKVPFLELLKVCTNPLDALEVLNKTSIDLIFVDIKMPNITGLDLIKTLTNPPLIIFTTAYSQHALEGFELSAVDYLIKPIPFKKFYKAVNKAYELHTLRKLSMQTQKMDDSESSVLALGFLLVKVEYHMVKINLNDICYIEGLKDYIRIHLINESVITKSTMKNIEEKLPDNRFIRLHKSFIVSIFKIEKIENNRIICRDKYIPIGEHYKIKYYDLLNKYLL